jgi:hypothetical protein
MTLLMGLAMGCTPSQPSQARPAPPAPPPTHALAANGPTILTARGQTVQLILTVTRSDGTKDDVTAAASWISTDPTTVSVSPSGLATAVRTGRAEIEATHDGGSARLSLLVDLPLPSVIIDEPSGDPTSLNVTFAWRLANADPERSYRFHVRLDKGQNACDTFIEETFSAETNTRLTVDLDPRRYAGASVDFGILAEDGLGFVICTQGRRFRLP